MTDYVFIGLFWLYFIVVPVIARLRGRSAIIWFLLSIPLCPLAIIILFLLPNLNDPMHRYRHPEIFMKELKAAQGSPKKYEKLFRKGDEERKTLNEWVEKISRDAEIKSILVKHGKNREELKDILDRFEGVGFPQTGVKILSNPNLLDQYFTIVKKNGYEEAIIGLIAVIERL